MLFVSVCFVFEPDYCIIVSSHDKPRCFKGKQWLICLKKTSSFVCNARLLKRPVREFEKNAIITIRPLSSFWMDSL